MTETIIANILKEYRLTDANENKQLHSEIENIREDYTRRLVDALFEQLNNHIVEKSIAMEIVTQLVKKRIGGYRC